MTDDQVDPSPGGTNQIRTVDSPFWYEDIKSGVVRSQLTHKFKILMILGAIGFGIWLMFQWFSGWFLLGFLTVPAWYFWALRQIDREYFTLIEVRLEGDKLSDDYFSMDTQINLFSIPPDIWKHLDKIGTPFSPGNRIYICDHFDYDGNTVSFPHDPRFTNMNFWSRLGVWLTLKDQLPQLEKKLALLDFQTEKRAMDRAMEILADTGAIRSPETMEIIDMIKQKPVPKKIRREVVSYGR